MNTALGSWMCGVGVGASAAFLLDPACGARRRSLIRDKVVRATYKTRNAADATVHDLGNRIGGVIAGTRSMFRTDTADDRVIVARVRAQLGRIASHPRAIHVEARGGAIVLTGDVLAWEVPSIISAITSVRGVDDVMNQMTVYASADGVSSLQGESLRPDQWSTWLRQGWSPTAMVLVSTAAAAAVATAVAVRRAA